MKEGKDQWTIMKRIYFSCSFFFFLLFRLYALSFTPSFLVFYWYCLSYRKKELFFYLTLFSPWKPWDVHETRMKAKKMQVNLSSRGMNNEFLDIHSRDKNWVLLLGKKEQRNIQEQQQEKKEKETTGMIVSEHESTEYTGKGSRVVTKVGHKRRREVDRDTRHDTGLSVFQWSRKCRLDSLTRFKRRHIRSRIQSERQEKERQPLHSLTIFLSSN